MAANLIYLKSRSLLPRDQQPPEEDAAEDDPRWELIRQLIEYKKFKEAAAELNLRALQQERIFIREAGSSPELQEPLRLGEVGIFQLISAFQTVIKRMEARRTYRKSLVNVLVYRRKSIRFCSASRPALASAFLICLVALHPESKWLLPFLRSLN